MDAERLARITDPFVTSRTTRKVGLGIPLFKAAAESCNGSFDIQSTSGLGTNVTAAFQESHIDRMPLGDLKSTLISLLIGYPDVHWVLEIWFSMGTSSSLMMRPSKKNWKAFH